MKPSKRYWLVLLMLLSGTPAFADSTGQVHLKAGEMGLNSFLEMVSERLDLQIDASGLDGRNDKISVPEAGPLSIERAKVLVLTSLYLEGYTWIHNSSNDLYRVLRLRDARDQEVPLLSDSDQLPDSDLLVTYLMNIKFTPPDYIARNLRSFMPANSRIIPDDTTGTVLITDSAHNLSKLKELIQRLDTPQAAKQAKDWLAERAKKADTFCPPPTGSNAQMPQLGVLIGLFSLIALVIGFLARGYVIRRIEGGL